MEKQNRIEVLDGLRVVAITMVMLFHFYTLFQGSFYNYSVPIPSVFKFGYLGVQLFFIISGFVITLTLTGCKSFLEFIKRRYVRLLPGMVICSVLTFVIISIFDSHNLFPTSKSVGNLILSNTFISPGYTNQVLKSHLTYTDGAYWSIGVEIQFYMIAALMYFWSKMNFLRNYLVFSVVSSLLYVAFSSHESFAFVKDMLGDHYYNVIHQVSRAFPLFEYNLWFAIGIIVNKLHNDKKNYKLISAFVLCYGLQVFYLNEFYSICFCLCTFAIFVSVVYQPHILSFLGNKVFQALGVSSYSVYLIHENIGILMINKFSPYFGPYSWVLPIIIIVVAFVFGVISYKYMESPFGLILKKILSSKPVSGNEKSILNTRLL